MCKYTNSNPIQIQGTTVTTQIFCGFQKYFLHRYSIFHMDIPEKLYCAWGLFTQRTVIIKIKITITILVCTPTDDNIQFIALHVFMHSYVVCCFKRSLNSGGIWLAVNVFIIYKLIRVGDMEQISYHGFFLKYHDSWFYHYSWLKNFNSCFRNQSIVFYLYICIFVHSISSTLLLKTPIVPENKALFALFVDYV